MAEWFSTDPSTLHKRSESRLDTNLWELQAAPNVKRRLGDLGEMKLTSGWEKNILHMYTCIYTYIYKYISQGLPKARLNLELH